jgi:hypothetical protein
MTSVPPATLCQGRPSPKMMDPHSSANTISTYLLRSASSESSVPASQNVSKSQSIQSSDHDHDDAEVRRWYCMVATSPALSS